MVIKLRNGNDSFLFINENSVKAVHFAKCNDIPRPYRIRIYAEQMMREEYCFENEELYKDALEKFCEREYEKTKLNKKD